MERLPSEADADFKHRLGELNSEMTRLLEAGKRQKLALRQEEDALHASGYRHGLATAQAVLGDRAATPRHDEIQRVVQQQVSAQLSGLADGMRALVAQEFDMRSKDLELNLRGRFAELKAAQDGLISVVREVATSLSELRTDVQAHRQSAEVALGRRLASLEKDLANVTKGVDTTTRELTGVVNHMEEQVKALQRQGAQRLNDLTERHTQLIREGFNGMELKLSMLRDEGESAAREVRRYHGDEIDDVKRVLGRIGEKVTASDEVSQKLYSQIAALFEQHGALVSRLRRCEQTVATESSSRAAEAAAAAKLVRPSLGPGYQQQQQQPQQSRQSTDMMQKHMDQLRQDVFLLKESVAFLASEHDRDGNPVAPAPQQTTAAPAARSPVRSKTAVSRRSSKTESSTLHRAEAVAEAVRRSSMQYQDPTPLPTLTGFQGGSQRDGTPVSSLDDDKNVDNSKLSNLGVD